jgi:hypothetical protein
MRGRNLFWFLLAALLAACGSEPPIAPSPPPPPAPAPAGLSIALHATGDPSALDRQKIEVYREDPDSAVLVATFSLGPNELTSLPLSAPAQYHVIRAPDPVYSFLGVIIPTGFARSWCAPTSSLAQTVLAVPAGNLAVDFSYDCPAAQGTGTLQVSVTTGGTGTPEPSFELVISRTGPGPSPPFYKVFRTAPANGMLDLELARGVYAVYLSETAACRVSTGLGQTLGLPPNSPAFVMLHPDGGTYVLQGGRRGSSLVKFDVRCQ